MTEFGMIDTIGITTPPSSNANSSETM